MERLNMNRKVFQMVAQWYLCVVLLLLLQLLIVLAWSFYGPLGNGMERFLEVAYGSPAAWIGNTFFEDRMTLGNAPLGLGMVLLVVIIYSFLVGTIIYFLCTLSSALSRGQ